MLNKNNILNIKENINFILSIFPLRCKYKRDIDFFACKWIYLKREVKCQCKYKRWTAIGNVKVKLRVYLCKIIGRFKVLVFCNTETVRSFLYIHSYFPYTERKTGLIFHLNFVYIWMDCVQFDNIGDSFFNDSVWNHY